MTAIMVTQKPAEIEYVSEFECNIKESNGKVYHLKLDPETINGIVVCFGSLTVSKPDFDEKLIFAVKKQGKQVVTEGDEFRMRYLLRLGFLGMIYPHMHKEALMDFMRFRGQNANPPVCQTAL